MKVFKSKKKEWWTTRSVTCIGCDATIKLEEGDAVETHSDRDGSGINFKCPECGKQIYVNKH